jgi:hypothetical protein
MRAIIYWQEHIKHVNEAEKSSKIQRLVIWYFIFLFLSASILLNNFSLPSKIAVAPFYNLNGIEYIDAKSLEAILDIIETREDFGSVRHYSGPYSDSYDFFWHGNINHSEPGGVRVNIWHPSNIEDAKKEFDYDWGKYKRISVSDYIKVNLYHSEMHRSADSLYAADWRKHGRTHVLIGNIMITIREEENFFRIGKWTSGSIEVLSEIFSSVMLDNEVEPGD